MTIITSSGCTNFVYMAKGIMQGERLSLNLFVIFIDDLIWYLIMYDRKGIEIRSAIEVQALGYANDYIILAASYVEMLKKNQSNRTLPQTK